MNSPTLLIPALLLLAAFGVPKPSTAQEIVALCIGNDAYHKPDDVLDTPVADATLMRDTLLALKGVKVSEEDVMLVTNATRIQMSQALRTFKAKAAGAKLALIFYSGHGMEDTPVGETRPETFLLPVDADITSLDVLPDLSIPLGDVLKAFEGSGGARAVILDCCRTGAPSANGALARAGKSKKNLDADVKRALGAAVVPEGTLIAFAAGPGRKAAAFLEKDDNHSPFTRFLTDEMKGSGGDLVTVVNAATRITKQRTENRQVPHVEVRGDLSLLTDFVIGGGRKANDEELAALRAELEAARRASIGSATPAGDTKADVVTPSQASKEAPYRNSLAMNLVPIKTQSPAMKGKIFLVSEYETRVKEFAAFVKETNYPYSPPTDTVNEFMFEGQKTNDLSKTGRTWDKPGFPQSNEHPVVVISWDDAREFCDWLTKCDRTERRIPASLRYRLPYHDEWAAMFGAVVEYRDDEAPDDAFKRLGFPNRLLWGEKWSKEAVPPKELGNLKDRSWFYDEEDFIGTLDRGTSHEIYEDRFQFTAPVGSFPPSADGLYDLIGNVNEMISDGRANGVITIRGDTIYPGALGGGWATHPLACKLEAVIHEGWPQSFAHTDVGFRVVLAED